MVILIFLIVHEKKGENIMKNLKNLVQLKKENDPDYDFDYIDYYFDCNFDPNCDFDVDCDIDSGCDFDIVAAIEAMENGR